MDRRVILSWSAAATLLTGSLAFAQIGNPQFQGMRTEDGVTVQVVGRVRSYDRNSFVLVVKGMTFEVSASRRDVIGNQDIRPGYRVRVFGDLQDRDRIDADRVMIVSRDRDDNDRPGGNRPGTSRARTITGTIREIDRQNNTITLGVPAGNVKVEWDRETQFSRNGQISAGPRDFKVGESVRVAGSRSGLNAITARRVTFGGQIGWSNGAVGEILSLDKRANELEVDFDGDVWTVKLANARLSRGGRRIEIDDLRLDQDIKVTGAAARGPKTVEATEIAVQVRGERN